MAMKNYYEEIFLNHKSTRQEVIQRSRALLIELNPTKKKERNEQYHRIHEAFVFLSNKYNKHFYDMFGWFGAKIAYEDRLLFFYSRLFQPKYLYMFFMSIMALYFNVITYPIATMTFGHNYNGVYTFISVGFMFITLFLAIIPLLLFYRLLSRVKYGDEKIVALNYFYMVIQICIYYIYSFIRLKLVLPFWINYFFFIIVLIDEIIDCIKVKLIIHNSYLDIRTKEYGRKMSRSALKALFFICTLTPNEYILPVFKGLIMIGLVSLIPLIEFSFKEGIKYAVGIFLLKSVYFCTYVITTNMTLKILQCIAYMTFMSLFLIVNSYLYKKWRSTLILSSYSKIPMLKYEYYPI